MKIATTRFDTSCGALPYPTSPNLTLPYRATPDQTSKHNPAFDTRVCCLTLLDPNVPNRTMPDHIATTHFNMDHNSFLYIPLPHRTAPYLAIPDLTIPDLIVEESFDTLSCCITLLNLTVPHPTRPNLTTKQKRA